jgi:P pilus assembly chaperone PapD
MKKILLFFGSFCFFLLSLFLLSESVSAKIGVGVGVGKITVEEDLRPGMIYQLPPMTVLNTGDEPSDYGVMVTHRENQPQLAPPEEWFSFSPKTFRLNPGEVQTINIRLNLPLKIPPGEYFAFLEGYPIKDSGGGATSVGVAAATKLYFKVKPANMVLGAYYRATSFWRTHQPWTNRVLAGLVIIFGLATFKKFFKIEVRANKANKNENQPNDK